MATPGLPPKKDVILALLEQTSVFLHLDPRDEKVVVPPWLKKQPQLVLQIGLNLAVAIRDLSVEDDHLSCTLSFNRAPFFCWIPWSAVFAVVGEDRRGMVWPDDVPPEVSAEAKAPSAPRRPAHLRSVGAEAPSEAEAEAPVVAEAPVEAPAEPKFESPRAVVARVESEVAQEREQQEREVAAKEREAAGKRKLPDYMRVVK